MPKKYGSPRKRVVGYIKVGLIDACQIENLVAEMEKFCRRHRLVLLEVVSEASGSQPRLKRLLGSIRSKHHAEMIVTASLAHFSDLSVLLPRLTEVQASGIGVAFMKEQLMLYPKASNTRTLFGFAESYVAAQRFSKSQNIKSSLKLAAIYGRTLGKPRLSSVIRKEVERCLRAGLSIRDVVKKVGNSHVSRASVGNMKREMRKRGEI